MDLFHRPSGGTGVSGGRSSRDRRRAPGQRQSRFRLRRQSDGTWIFFAAAADRPTRAIDAASAERLIFPSADRLWKSYQSRLVDFINHHGGRARIGPARATRHDWAALRSSGVYDSRDQPAWVRIPPREP